MIGIILLSLIVLVATVLTIHMRQRNLPDGNPGPVIPAPSAMKGLFDRPDPPLVEKKQKESPESNRQQLLERAWGGDLNVLAEAHSAPDPALYSDTLDALIEGASLRQESLAALVSHVSKSDELRANTQLAQRLIETWKTAPDRRSTIEMIHIAALSDDPETYEKAIDAVLELWRSTRLPWFTPEELARLFVTQYWVVRHEARRGGPGFALKRRLKDVRRELAATKSAS